MQTEQTNGIKCWTNPLTGRSTALRGQIWTLSIIEGKMRSVFYLTEQGSDWRSTTDDRLGWFRALCAIQDQLCERAAFEWNKEVTPMDFTSKVVQWREEGMSIIKFERNNK